VRYAKKAGIVITRSISAARILGAAVLATTMTALAGAVPAHAAASSPPSFLALRPVVLAGSFVAPSQPGPAEGGYLYISSLAPPGATAYVSSLSNRNTVSALLLSGWLPNRVYGAHLHRAPCGPDPLDAGGHYQYIEDPVQPSVNPAYVNPANEVWLDVATDAQGNGRALSVNNWSYNGRTPASLVIHEHATSRGLNGEVPGDAGPRVACVNLVPSSWLFP